MVISANKPNCEKGRDYEVTWPTYAIANNNHKQPSQTTAIVCITASSSREITHHFLQNFLRHALSFFGSLYTCGHSTHSSQNFALVGKLAFFSARLRSLRGVQVAAKATIQTRADWIWRRIVVSYSYTLDGEENQVRLYCLSSRRVSFLSWNCPVRDDSKAWTITLLPFNFAKKRFRFPNCNI